MRVTNNYSFNVMGINADNDFSDIVSVCCSTDCVMLSVGSIVNVPGNV